MKKGILCVMAIVCSLYFLPGPAVSADDVTCQLSSGKLYILSTFPSDTLLLSLLKKTYPAVQTLAKAMGHSTNSATGMYTWHAYYIDSAGEFQHYWIELTMTKNTNSATMKTNPYFWMYTVYIPITVSGVTTNTTCSGLLQTTY